jgi:hypothetical protein
MPVPSGKRKIEPVSTAIVPRWECRTFASRFDADVDRRFDGLPTEHVDESDETHLVSPRIDASVKVRAGLVAVGVLLWALGIIESEDGDLVRAALAGVA